MSAEPEKPRYHRGNVRADLIKAALARLRAEGAGSLTLSGLAQAIGLSAPAVYNHFRNKEALFAAIAIEGLNQLHGLQADAVEAAAPGDELAAAALAYIRFSVAEPGLYGLMFGRSIENRRLYPELIKAEDDAFRLLGTLHYDKIDRRKRVQDYPAALITWATLHGLAALICDRQISFRSESELEAIVRAAVQRAGSPG